MTINIMQRLLCFMPILFLSACSSIMGITSQGPIQDSPDERTMGMYIDDEWIETKAEVNITKSDPAFKKAHVNAISYNGIVLLVGQVPSERLHQLAGDVVRKIQKVRKVDNQTTVAGNISFLARSNDTLISMKIKTKMMGEKNINSSKIKVVTEDGAVFLMGLITRTQSNTVVDIARKTSGVRKIVKVFEYID